jgi:methionyl-tRNA formyltransferase
MKVIILTTSEYGTTGHHLPVLYGAAGIEIAMVVVSTGPPPVRKNHRIRRLKKVFKIGPLGALNGIKMRKWYNEDVKQYCTIESARMFCEKHNIPFRNVPYTNSELTQQLFRESGADIGLSLGNGYISARVFGIPRYGMLNVHHEILPQYQNAQSIIWQLYNGSAETGYTIHKIDKNIDTGEIVLQEKVPIMFRSTLDDTVAFNYARLFDASVRGLLTVFAHFDRYFFNAKPQGKGGHYTTPSYPQFLKIKRQFNRLKKEKG